FMDLKWLSIPWTSVGIVGTAVSFYIGFKNNQAYDRLWEARKIWGSMINNSRIWGSNLRAYITNHFTDNEISDKQVKSIIKRLIYRHISYLYTLRNQLLEPAPWEHISLNSHVAKLNKDRMKKFGIGTFEDNLTDDILNQHLDKAEYKELRTYSNMATQIIDVQSQELMQLRKDNIIDDFRHIELQKILNEFYSEQGKAERIKKFPLPRQYGSVSFIFVSIFVFLLPFGLIAEFEKIGSFGIWFFIPVVSIIAWIFILMELVGDYSENPFEGLGNDVPMLSICRTIEIDLKQMIKDDKIPEPIASKNGVLM
ncbi:MAG TPA: bestrophin family ion channel, partial [Bacteroidia bacterium]